MAQSPETSAAPLAWKEPSQARSRARVAAILDASRDLAAEAGHLDIKMMDVAARAGVPIGSVYQYFPTRSALLARLFAREMAPVDTSLREGLKAAKTPEEVIDGIAALIRTHVELVRAQPGLFVIWASPTMDPALQAADLENSRANANAITDAILAMAPGAADEGAIADTALLICHLWGGVIRLAVMTADQGAAPGVIDQYSAMIASHVRELLG